MKCKRCGKFVFNEDHDCVATTQEEPGMKYAEIKRGHWYKTRHGIGQAIDTGKRHPPAIKFNIVRPFALGERFVAPREVECEVEAPDENAQ